MIRFKRIFFFSAILLLFVFTTVALSAEFWASKNSDKLLLSRMQVGGPEDQTI